MTGQIQTEQEQAAAWQPGIADPTTARGLLAVPTTVAPQHSRAIIDVGRAEIAAGRIDGAVSRTWYNSTVENLGASRWAYCAAFASWCYAMGGAAAISRPRSWVPHITLDGLAKALGGEWTWGFAGIAPLDKVVYTWSRRFRQNPNDGDHVGIVTEVRGNAIRVLEGNATGGKTVEIWRDDTYVLGYWRGDFSRLSGAQPPDIVVPQPKPKGALRVDIIDLSNASNTNLVRAPGMVALQRLLGVRADGLGGRDTRAALERAQARAGVDVDGEFGPDSAEAFLAGRGI